MVGLTIEVKNKTIKELMTEVKSGKYFLPSFQRQYVWDEDDIGALIDSIVSNYPIGTIILWKPSNASGKGVDPFSKPLIDVEGKQPSERFYVIDGQQRLTSLLLLFNDWKITRDKEEVRISIPIHYDPTKKRFYKSVTKGIDLSELVRAFCLQDINALTELTTRIPKDQLEDVKERIEKILFYVIPVYVMETFDENEETFKSMAEAFIRVNRYGVRIGNLELMLSFLAGSISGDLKERIRDLYEDLFKQFEIDLQPVIRFVFSNFGLKQTQISKVEQFKRNISTISSYDTSARTRIFDGCNKALNLALHLLKSELGIKNSRLLPSQTPLVPLAFYLYTKNVSYLEELDSIDVKKIVDWYLLVSFNGYYSSKTDTKLDKDLEIIKKSSAFPFDKLLENMQNEKAKIKISRDDIQRGLDLNVLRHQGRAYLFLLYVILVKKEADDWRGVLISRRNLNELAVHHIFPQQFLTENLNIDEPDSREAQINNLANITFINKNVNSEIGDTPPEQYLGNYIGSAKKHFIPNDESLWKLEQYKTFLDYRISEIYLSGRELFGTIFE